MRLRSLVITSALLIAAGCSSKAATEDAPTEEPAAASPERAADPTLPSSDPAATPPADDTTAPPGSLGAGGGGDAGAEGGSGTGTGTGTGTGGGTGGGNGGGGSKCVNGSVAETEANDSAAAANEMPGATGSFCGKLSAAADVDFVKFTLPAEAVYLSYNVSLSAPGVKVEFTVGDKTFGPGQALVFSPGATYVAKISTTGTAPVDYRLDIEIKK